VISVINLSILEKNSGNTQHRNTVDNMILLYSMDL
jgi:hypothetical protein